MCIMFYCVFVMSCVYFTKLCLLMCLIVIAIVSIIVILGGAAFGAAGFFSSEASGRDMCVYIHVYYMYVYIYIHIIHTCVYKHV